MTQTVPGAATLDDFPLLGWEDFEQWFKWRQGQHVGMVGPTECGKTTFALSILERRRFAALFGTKPRDDVLTAWAQTNGYRRMNRWEQLDPVVHPHRLLWPPANDIYAAKTQQPVFREAMRSIFKEGGWTLFLDELWYLSNVLKLDIEARIFWLQARSNKISLVVATQRPAWVPLEMYDQSSWLMFWRDNDETNLRRISGISYLSRYKVQNAVASLPQHQALVVNTRTGEMVRTQSPEVNGGDQS